MMGRNTEIQNALSRATDKYISQQKEKSKEIQNALNRASEKYLVKKYTPMAQEMLKNGASAADARAALRYTVLPEAREDIAAQYAAAAQPAELTREQKYAQRNAENIAAGKPLEINDGRIYTFEALTPAQYQASIDWANDEIERLKAAGGSSGVLGYIKEGAAAATDFALNAADILEELPLLGGFIGQIRDSDVVSGIEDDITEYIYNNADNSEAIRDMEDYRNTLQQYYNSAVEQALVQRLDENAEAKRMMEDYFEYNVIMQGAAADKLSYTGDADSAKELEEAIKRYDTAAANRRKCEDWLLANGYTADDMALYADISNRDFMNTVLADVVKMADEHPVITTGVNILLSPLRGSSMLADKYFEASGIHGLDAGALLSEASQLTQETVIESIEEGAKTEFGAGVGRVFYTAAVSSLESLLMNGVLGKGAELLLGLDAGMSAYNSATERGLSGTQALITGISAGLFEAVFEHISLDKLRAFQTSPSTTLLPLIKNVLKQTLVEGTEEIFTDLANEMCDVLVNGGLSNYAQALNSGMTTGEYVRQFTLQLIETFATGAVSGGGSVAVSGAPYAISGSVKTIQSDKKQGSVIRKDGLQQEVTDGAKAQGGLLGKQAERTEARINDGKNVSDRTLGQLERNTERQERANIVDSILADTAYEAISDKQKKAVRSSVLSWFTQHGNVSYEQKQVLDTELGKKVFDDTLNAVSRKITQKINTRQEKKRSDIRAAVKEKNTEGLVKETFEAKNAEGYSVEIGAVRSISDGELEIVQDKDSGATARLSELKISDKDAAELYAELQKAATGNNAMSVDSLNIALSMYSRYENKSAESYIAWAHDAYKAGMLKKDNTVLSFAEFEKMFEGSYSGDITREQLYQMYEAGARNLETTPGVTLIGARGLTKNQTEQVFIINQLAKKSGTQVVIINGKLTDNDGRGINGLYKSGTNRIVLSLQGEYNLVLVHAGHEMFHYAKSLNGDWGMYLQNMVINVLKSDSKYDFDGIYKQVSEDYEGLSEDEILEEIAAQYLGVALSNEATIKKIVNEADTKERTFLQNLIQHLKEFIRDIKKLLNIYGSEDKTVRAAVETPLSQLEYIADEFMRVLEETGKNKKPTESDGGVKASLKTMEEVPTVENIASVRSIGRKSINTFTSEEITKTQYWAKMFWSKLKEKSPYFRAWFGDWRAYDTNNTATLEIQVLPFTDRIDAEKYIKNGIKNKTLFRGDVVNSDTDFAINIGSQVYDDTLTYSNRRYSRDKNFNEYIVRLSLLQQVDKIVKDAILLDSFVSDSDKNPYQSFMHKFYAIANVGGKDYLVKLSVDELNSSDNPIRRAYNVNSIKIAPIAGSQVYEPAFTTDATGESISNISISNLFEIVKKYDDEFKPNPVNPAFLNEDGTPKVFYHGTNARWTEYDLSKNVNQMWGEGIYLTPDYNRAKLYGDNVMPFYVRALVDNRTAKKTGQKRDHTIMKNGDVLVYSPEQIKSATDNIGTFDRTKKDVRYSYAGVKAKTADIKTFDYAARLEDVGKASPEEIRQQTGWFRGYDNKWRFEISDRDMQIDTRDLFSMNPDVRRYTQLVDKAYFDMTATEEEMQELIVLEKNLEGVSTEPKTLGELIHHPALFEAYPQLKDIKVYFDDIEPRGAYNPVFNEITLQKKLKLDKSKLAKTLVHEIQHAVQEIEGFAGGASTSYWEAVYRDEYITLEGMKKNLDMWLKDIGFTEYVQKSMQQVISKEKTMAQHWEDLESFKQNSRYAREIASCENAIEEFKKTLPDPADLYERTAGEIEARDAALRHWRTDEARKEKRPDIDRTDVVFAEGEILSLDIKTDADGNKFVDVNPELFDARDGESHAKTIARIIKDRFNNLISVNGQQIQINKTTNREWLRSESATYLAEKQPALYLDKLKTIPFAHEILKAANNWIGEKPNHKRKDDIVEFARGEVLYRVGANGYIADVLVGIRSNGAAVLYSLKNIYEKEITDMPLTMASKNSQRSEDISVTDNVTQSAVDVKTKYSRQRLGDAWEDIRTKMYENQVHEDIINEVEEHIINLRSRNLSRETAITEGLVPTYEALLKVSRQFVKGSDVSAQELTDTLNELVWAAHDGNLDTKQFISTVKLIATDIITSGKKVNDDRYREYEEFRRMTREETVYVSQQVYDQYAEEYGSVKNLNRAVAGKIKIKPYTDGNRTGRALDDFYAELQERFPELFKEDVDVYHQLYEIISAWQSIQPVTEYFSDILGIKTQTDLEHQSLIVAEDILAEVLGIKETVKTLADKYADKTAFMKEHYKEYYRKQAEEGRRKRKEAEEINTLNKRIQRNTARLSDMLRNETDQRHIPENFKEAVMEFLNMFIGKNNDGRTVIYSTGTLNLVKLGNAYASYYSDGIEMSRYDEDVVQWIEELAVSFGDSVDIKKLSVFDLRKIDKIVSHFSHIIKHENEMFIDGRRVKAINVAISTIREMYQHIKKPEYEFQRKILDAEYGMLTPIYFFKTIGTTSVHGNINEEYLYKMYGDLRNGQDKWYRNIERSRNQIADIKSKYNYNKSWRRDTFDIELDSGDKIRLTAEEIMYMWALYHRETEHINNLNHLLEGGIIVESDGRLKGFAKKKESFREIRNAREDFKKNDGIKAPDLVAALKKDLTTEDISKIFANLTDDMKAYSSALVEMLSTSGAELGNEVSMELYGIRKYTEKNYIPISVAEEFLQFSVDRDKSAGASKKLKNRSFTKRTVRDANATIYVRSITDIAAEHMQEMSLYNAMTVPIENFTRVFNYKKPADEFFSDDGILQRKTGNSFKEIFKAVYGERALKYFENFIRDVNGGNQMQARDFMSRMMGMFKKSAVMGSLSVAIQQPSAVVRACALVDAKYFIPKLYSEKDYLELLEYCPVAGIKEIGRFDTGIGQTATEWMLNEPKGALGKAEDVLSYLPGMMDRITWVYIWNAVKREARATNKGIDNAELLTLAAKRFRDVIDYTQVYDSTLSRSGFMRDQGAGAKMVTAFLAEPTLSYNLVRDSVRNAGNDKKQAAKSIAAFAGATLLNAILKSVITALRKDDDESNYFEIYISDVVSNFFDDAFLLNSLPIIKDVISIFSGYDVERPDMTLFANFYNAAKVLNKEGHTPTWDEILGFAGAFSAFTQIPLNNVIKDVTAIIKTVAGFENSPNLSLTEVGYRLSGVFGAETEDYIKIYNAIIAGDTELLDRYRAYNESDADKYIDQGYSEADALAKALDVADNRYHSKVMEGLISEEIRIQEAADALVNFRYEEYEELVEEVTELGFDRNDVISAIDKYISSLEEKEYTPSGDSEKSLFEYKDLHNAISAENLQATLYAVNALKETGKEDKNIRSSLTGKFKDVYISYCATGNDSGMQRLKELLLACDVGYTDKTFSEWEKEYLKNK